MMENQFLNKIIVFLLFFLIGSSLFAQEYYQVKKFKEDNPIVLKVKKIDKNKITVITNDLVDLEIPLEDIDYMKEFNPNAERLYRKVIIFASNEYLEAYLVSSNTKKIVVEVKGQKELMKFRTSILEDLVSPEEFWEERNKTRVQAMMRSIAFPGWGQYYGNQPKWKTVALISTFFFSIIGATNYYNLSQSAYSSYQSSFFFNTKKLDEHIEYTNMANGFAFIGFSVWGYSMFDAYIFFKPKYNQEPHRLQQNETRIEIGIEKPI